MKWFSFSIIFSLLFIQCNSKKVEKEKSVAIEPLGYYSDYFVFMADDGGDPLVVPIDINWSWHKEGYEVEYKSWYGTAQDWPIEYFKKNIQAKQSDIPNEAFEHLNTDRFSFDKENRSIVAKIKGSHEIRIQIPKKKKWVLPNLKSDFPTYAYKTTIEISGKSRSGWMLYERIRFDALKKFEGFEAFYWMPMLVNGDLYHFTQHKGKQTAAKWSNENDKIIAETAPEFEFKIVETIPDSKSKRTAIAKTVQIQVPQWGVDITLKSTGEQVGYGEEYTKGLAYFRQSLLRANEDSKNSGYGMMELILADD